MTRSEELAAPEPPDGGRRTAFLVVEQGFAARFLLRTDVLRTFTEAGVRVVVLAPNPDEEYLVEELAAQGVELEPLRANRQVVQRSRWWWLVHNLRTFALGEPRRSRAFLDYYHGFRGQVAADHSWIARCIHLALQSLWRSRRLRRALLAVEARLFTRDLHHDLFERHRPDLVVTTSPGWFLPDALVLREARRRGVRTAAVVLAWDNPTNKGYRGAEPDLTIVWSQRMAEQIVRHHDYPRERILVGGVPHFDPYLRADGLPSRDELFARMGLDPQRRLILFATRSPASYPHSPVVAEALARTVSDGALGHPAQLVVRLHPVSFRPGYDLPLDEYRRLSDRHPHVHLDVPTVVSQRLRSDMPATETTRLGALIKHCDVLVNVFSTTSLEAMLVDRPVVMVSPDAHLSAGDGAARGAPEWPREFADYEHTRELVERGAARVANSMAELVEHVAGYLDDPARDGPRRREAAARECGPMDGRSGRRVGRYLLDAMGAAPADGARPARSPSEPARPRAATGSAT
ncbi:MAG TPA: hypothetical protein VKA96_02740 [Solirubrobacteraceae bacterium]|nr:hypothetical protein [Solirubrobacteraceae bacterium]